MLKNKVLIIPKKSITISFTTYCIAQKKYFFYHETYVKQFFDGSEGLK